MPEIRRILLDGAVVENVREGDELVARDGIRIEYQRALAGAYENLGSVFEHDHKCGPARAYYAKALNVFDALSARGALSAEYAGAPGRLKKSIAGCK